MALLGGHLEELGSSLQWGSESRMTGLFPPWTVTLKGDERSSRLHFSSSNWAAIIREVSLTRPPPLSLSPTPLSLISGEVEESVCVPRCFDSSFSSAPPHLSHAFALFLSPRGQWEMFPFQFFTCNSGADFVVTKSFVNFLFVAILRSRTTDCSYHSNISLPCFVFS